MLARSTGLRSAIVVGVAGGRYTRKQAHREMIGRTVDRRSIEVQTSSPPSLRCAPPQGAIRPRLEL